MVSMARRLIILYLQLVVDQAMEVVDEYQSKILKLEHDILVKPSMKAVRYRGCLQVIHLDPSAE